MMNHRGRGGQPPLIADQIANQRHDESGLGGTATTISEIEPPSAVNFRRTHAARRRFYRHVERLCLVRYLCARPGVDALWRGLRILGLNDTQRLRKLFLRGLFVFRLWCQSSSGYFTSCVASGSTITHKITTTLRPVGRIARIV